MGNRIVRINNLRDFYYGDMHSIERYMNLPICLKEAVLEENKISNT